MASLPLVPVTVDLSRTVGPAQGWRHALSQGGVSHEPLPDAVVTAVRSTGVKRIRVFIQEFFALLQAPGEYDWVRLDAYLDSIAATGAEVVAAITIKPPLLYPTVDHEIWEPNDWGQWQELITALVHRYSVERPIVTHWEIGNEVEAGDPGGAPYRFNRAEDYVEYYRRTVEAVHRGAPDAKVGGPALAFTGVDPIPGFPELLPGFLAGVAEQGLPLDFVSWHRYDSDPEGHLRDARHVRNLLARHGLHAETMVTEWNKSFIHPKVAEHDWDPGWAANVASVALATLDDGADWYFHYHVWDDSIDPERFANFLSPHYITSYVGTFGLQPARLGLFDWDGNLRPSFFVLEALNQLEPERAAVEVGETRIRALAGFDEDSATVLITTDPSQGGSDRIVDLHVTGVPWRRLRYTLRRIDDDFRHHRPELPPVEARTIWTEGEFRSHLHLPADSVLIITLSDAAASDEPRS